MCCGQESLAEEIASDLRRRVVDEALSWVGTPYAHYQRVKGAGVDCATLLIEVYGNVGLVDKIDPGWYPSEWYMHQSEERYLAYLLRYGDEVAAGLPGDIAMFRFGKNRCAHTGILTGPDRFIHAWLGSQAVCIEVMNPGWRRRQSGFIRVKGL